MPSLTALETYQTIMHRLPSIKKPIEKPKTIESLLDIADDFDYFFFDAFGVLNVGNHPIERAPEVVEALRNKGKVCFIVSNAASFEKQVQVNKYQNYGYPFSADEIITSRDAVIEGVKQFPEQIQWGLIAPEEHQEDLKKQNIHYKTIQENGFWQSEGFLFLSALNWNNENQQLLIKHLKEKPRPILLGNPDLIAPQGGNSSIEPGSYILPLEDALFEQVQVFGKPFPAIFQIAVQRVINKTKAFNPSRALMIGDTLQTDILGGRAFGIQTLLVTGHGFLKDLNAEKIMANTKIFPHFIVKSI